MALLADIEIKEAMQRGEIEIDPFDEEKCLRSSSSVSYTHLTLPTNREV